MKYFVILLFLTINLSAAETKEHALYMQTSKEILAKRSDPARWFITADGKPTTPLIRLLQIDNLYDPNDTLDQIAKKTQTNWVEVVHGKNLKEIPDLKDTPAQQEMRQKVEAIAEEIGLFDERSPALTHYDYAACPGAFVDGVRHRLSYLIELWKKGLRFDKLIFFTGARPLRLEKGREDDIEKITSPQNSPLTIKAGWKLQENAPYKTEYDMCKLIWEQTEIPDDMYKSLEGKVVFINAPAPEGQERPSTKSCYITWLKEYTPEPGTILAASHPMLWCYQQLSGENALGSAFLLDTCARGATAQVRQRYQERIVSLIQNTVAKCLYEIDKK